MRSRDVLVVQKSSITVPPRVLSQLCLEHIPFPVGSDCAVAIEAETGRPISDKAFDDNGELLVISEFAWAAEPGVKHFNGRRLPYCVKENVSDAAFSHELGGINDYSVDSLFQFAGRHGLLFLPFFESHRRFLDSRYQDSLHDEESPFLYRNIYPDYASEDDIKASFDTGGGDRQLVNMQQDLWNAFNEIRFTAKLQEGEMPLLHRDPLDFVDYAEIEQAVILSEYARRQLTRDKDDMQGGIVSYYEVYLTVRILQRSMKLIEAYETAGTDLDALARGLTDDDIYKGEAVRRILEDPTRSELLKMNQIHNLWEADLERAVHFLNLCVFSTPGARAMSIERKRPSGDDLYGEGHWVSTRYLTGDDVKQYDLSLLNPRYYMECRNPLYFENVYCEGSYSSMIAAQFLNVLSSDLEWKVCKNPECNRFFKLKYSPGKTNERMRQSEYCCDSCANAERNKRNNAEMRVITLAKRRFKAKRPGFETLEATLAYVEENLSEFYKEDRASKLPEARERWRKKLEK